MIDGACRFAAHNHGVAVPGLSIELNPPFEGLHMVTAGRLQYVPSGRVDELFLGPYCGMPSPL